MRSQERIAASNLYGLSLALQPSLRPLKCHIPAKLLVAAKVAQLLNLDSSLGNETNLSKAIVDLGTMYAKLKPQGTLTEADEPSFLAHLW